MHGMDYFCGVPDSLLKDFCAYVTAVTPKSRHVITSNEGQAIALAAGYHMATGRAGVVYLQVGVVRPVKLEYLNISLKCIKGEENPSYDKKLLDAFHSTQNTGNSGWRGKWNRNFPE